ncbi:MAG: hypothetical protein AB1Z98_23920 [Nannocystaceae bacterium]
MSFNAKSRALPAFVLGLLTTGCVITTNGDDSSNATASATTPGSGSSGSGSGGNGTDDSSTTSGASADSGGVTGTDGADETTGSAEPSYPDYAGEGTLRLLADGVDLAGHDSVAASLNAADSRIEVGDLRVYAYFADSGNRVIVRVPAAKPGEYEVTDVDGPGAVVDVLLNTDATGLEQRIEGVLEQGTVLVDELDVVTGRVRMRWQGTMTRESASGLTDVLATAGALDVELSVAP